MWARTSNGFGNFFSVSVTVSPAPFHFHAIPVCVNWWAEAKWQKTMQRYNWCAIAHSLKRKHSLKSHVMNAFWCVFRYTLHSDYCFGFSFRCSFFIVVWTHFFRTLSLSPSILLLSSSFGICSAFVSCHCVSCLKRSQGPLNSYQIALKNRKKPPIFWNDENEKVMQKCVEST